MQDVVSIPPKFVEKTPEGEVNKLGEVVIRTQFKDFDGRFVFHCHILKHEDAGMMLPTEVLK